MMATGVMNMVTRIYIFMLPPSEETEISNPYPMVLSEVCPITDTLSLSLF